MDSYIFAVWFSHYSQQHCFNITCSFACVQLPCYCSVLLFWGFVFGKKTINSTIFILIMIAFNCRHTTNVESDSHHLLGVKPVWHFLYPGGSRALLHRRVHRLLHHHSPLPLLPHVSQHPCLPAEPQGAHLVPHVLLLWVQRERTCPQPVPLALQQTGVHEDSGWIEGFLRRACTIIPAAEGDAASYLCMVRSLLSGCFLF